ncbi:hypothetical protein [Streptomyces sp. NEAU-174]|uniref:hypothetical protein n=1 Tax=Streptomyces sp. NEAU-174 TaxID=3458254 RepID=UPI00404484B7
MEHNAVFVAIEFEVRQRWTVKADTLTAGSGHAVTDAVNDAVRAAIPVQSQNVSPPRSSPPPHIELGTEDRVVAGGLHHPFARRRRLRWAELVDHALVVNKLSGARTHPHPGVRYIAIADAPPVPPVLVRPTRASHPLTDHLERIASTATNRSTRHARPSKISRGQ